MDAQIQQAIQLLEKSGFSVFNLLQERDVYCNLTEADGKIVPLLVVDVETTGLDSQVDKTIEIGAVLVECGIKSGRLGRVLDVYSGLEDPGFPLPEEISKITGIYDDDVRGQQFDDQKVESLAQEARLVLAHNASLDRAFLEKRYPSFAKKWWVCSYKEGPWKAMGVGSSKLDYLAFKVGRLVFDAHRAINDVRALIHVLTSSGSDGAPVMKNIIAKTKETSSRIWVTGAPYDIKDILKKEEYEWCGEDKVVDGEKVCIKSWNKEVFGAEALDQEMEFLSSIYPGGKITVDTKDGRDRYSSRIGERKIVEIERKRQPKP